MKERERVGEVGEKERDRTYTWALGRVLSGGEVRGKDSRLRGGRWERFILVLGLMTRTMRVWSRFGVRETPDGLRRRWEERTKMCVYLCVKECHPARISFGGMWWDERFEIVF